MLRRLSPRFSDCSWVTCPLAVLRFLLAPQRRMWNPMSIGVDLFEVRGLCGRSAAESADSVANAEAIKWRRVLRCL